MKSCLLSFQANHRKGKSESLVKMVFLLGVIFLRQRTMSLLQQLKHKDSN
ncbi:Uncharacterised protein [Enterobacter hormaechei]|nr:Uncharacterised protein [Enterobacter hormaechei]